MSFADEIRKNVKRPQDISISSSELEILERNIISTLVEKVKNGLKESATKGRVKNNRVLCCLDLQGKIDRQKKPNVSLTYYDGAPFSYYVTSISKGSLSRIINGIIQECRGEGIKLDEGNIFTTNLETLGEKKRKFIEGKGGLCMFRFYVKI